MRIAGLVYPDNPIQQDTKRASRKDRIAIALLLSAFGLALVLSIVVAVLRLGTDAFRFDPWMLGFSILMIGVGFYSLVRSDRQRRRSAPPPEPTASNSGDYNWPLLLVGGSFLLFIPLVLYFALGAVGN